MSFLARTCADHLDVCFRCDRLGEDVEPTGGQFWYEDLTAEAVDRGVFGAPTFFVEDQMFWGNDRLDFLVEAYKAL